MCFERYAVATSVYYSSTGHVSIHYICRNILIIHIYEKYELIMLYENLQIDML